MTAEIIIVNNTVRNIILRQEASKKITLAVSIGIKISQRENAFSIALLSTAAPNNRSTIKNTKTDVANTTGFERQNGHIARQEGVNNAKNPTPDITELVIGVNGKAKTEIINKTRKHCSKKLFCDRWLGTACAAFG
ncbi:MAG: hypothetical protein ABGY11_11350 [Candidatus Thioglobus sp.]